MKKKIKKIGVQIALPILLVLIWEIAAILLNKPFVLPRVEAVIIILAHPIQKVLGTGTLIENAIVSISRVLSGFLLAALIAIPVGIGMGYFKRVSEFVNTLIELLRPIPPLAWVPLALAWFGTTAILNLVGIESFNLIFYNLQVAVIFIIFVGSFFPILLSTIGGVKSVRITLIETALTLGAKEKDILRKVVIPGASPSILTGLRIGVGIAWMCVVAAEMLPGSNIGLGYLIIHAYDYARVDIVIAGMIVIGVIGLCLDTILRIFEERFKWRAR